MTLRYRALLALLGLLLFAALSAGQTTQTVLSGVYTADQAAKGEAEYDSACIKCHEGNDPEGPPLMGRAFVERWREDSLDPLFHYMKNRMPADAAGSLPEAAYLEVLAFLLRANEYPAGSKPLDVASLPHIRLVGKDGPKPLPPNSLIKIVGCLAEVSADDWAVTQATEPVRTRQGRETTPDELQSSKESQLGSLTFKVSNFTNIAFDFKPAPLKGHKVQVKGVLIRSSTGGGDRVSLTSLESLSANCTP